MSYIEHCAIGKVTELCTKGGINTLTHAEFNKTITDRANTLRHPHVD